MLEKMKRTLEAVFSGGHGMAAIERHPPRLVIAAPSDNGAASEILDILRDQGVPTTFFLSGTRPEPHVLPDTGKTDSSPTIPPEPFLARPDRSDDLRACLRPTPTPCFVRLPHAGGYGTLRVHRLLHDRQFDCLLVHWASSEEESSLVDTGPAEQDLVARCREAAERAFADNRVAGTLILMHEDSAVTELPLSAHLAPLLLREVLSSAREPHWAVIGIGAPLPA